jgi:hypothetical protein
MPNRILWQDGAQMSEWINIQKYHDNQEAQTHLRILDGIVRGIVRYRRDPQTYDLLVNVGDVKAVNKKYKYQQQQSKKQNQNSEKSIAEPTNTEHSFPCTQDEAKGYFSQSDCNNLYIATTNRGYAICPLSKLLQFITSLPMEDSSVDECSPHNGIVKISLKKR